jgi:hypothetical protein
MKLLEKLKSDLLIAESELSILNEIISGNSSEISFILYQTTKAKVDCINKQISEIEIQSSKKDWIDRRDGGYFH